MNIPKPNKLTVVLLFALVCALAYRPNGITQASGFSGTGFSAVPVTRLGGSLAISKSQNSYLSAIFAGASKRKPTSTPTRIPTRNALTSTPVTIQSTSTPQPTLQPTLQSTAPAQPTIIATMPPTKTPTTVPTVPSGEKAKAFPGAEGFGAAAVGGRGGKVIEVTNLNDSGTGSLRTCASASGPRICIFKVGGTIMLNSSIVITNPYLTIAGQTAPGGGILIRNSPTATTYTPFVVHTHEVIIRYITVRGGPTSGGGDSMGVKSMTDNKAYNVVIDHNSFSWGVDENFSTWYDVHDISLQWNIFAEGLDCSTHPKGCHSKGVMLGSYSADETKTTTGAYNFSFHHNFITNNMARNPLVKTSGVIDLVNNVSYNSRNVPSSIDMQSMSIIPVNYVGNYFKAGPNTLRGIHGTIVTEVGGNGVSIYVKGNYAPSRTSDTQPETDFVDPRSLSYVTSTRHAAAPVTTTSSLDAYNSVLTTVGNNQGLDSQGKWYIRRDAVDQRLIAEIKAGGGKIIDAPGASTCPDPTKYPDHPCIYLTSADYTKYGVTSPLAADGWPVIAGGTGYKDSDHDGMPDDWETINGFNPGSAADGPQDRDGDGYTNLEEFLNGTAP